MRIKPCLLCTALGTQALTMSSYLTPLTNSQTAPLMFEPIHGDEVYCPSDPFNQTLIDDTSIDCRKHAMVHVAWVGVEGWGWSGERVRG